MKLGGLASIVTGYDGYKRDVPPSLQDFVAERCAYSTMRSALRPGAVYVREQFSGR